MEKSLPYISALTSQELIIAVVAGLLVLGIAFTVKKILGIDNNSHESGVSQTNTTSPSQSVVINNAYAAPVQETGKADTTDDSRDVLELKARTKILFIEDGAFKQITNLKTAGWFVSQIKDVIDLDTHEIRNANIIFVDYKDVGKKLSDEEGLGVVRSLKERYGDTKWIILYSAHPLLLSVFKKGADSYLAKNSSLAEIEYEVIQGAQSLSR